jgi:hypothetical protein
MIPSALKTILIDSDLDDSALLLDVQHPYRDKDLLTNQFDDAEDDVNDQVRKSFQSRSIIHRASVLFSPFACAFITLPLLLLLLLFLSISKLNVRVEVKQSSSQIVY